MTEVKETLHNANLEYEINDGYEISVKNLTLYKPDGREIFSNLDLTIAKGDKLMVTGGSGRGKSTLLKALAGIWPYGNGTIKTPGSKYCMFLPQKAYMPMGTLRDILIYPATDASISDGQITDMLKLCNLPQLVGRINETANWGQMLSLGEQQRISFARLFLLKPAWAFLDEATSALDVESEAEMYRLLDILCPSTTVISVAHRLYLREVHNRELSSS